LFGTTNALSNAWQISLPLEIFTCNASTFGKYGRAAWQGASRLLVRGFC
jgi:hypothetical protein